MYLKAYAHGIQLCSALPDLFLPEKNKGDLEYRTSKQTKINERCQ